MNGYELTNRMRKSRRNHPLTPTEQALYHELVAICNEEEWPDVFSCSNDELRRALGGIAENTLNAARLTLIQRGLIFYKSGKSKRHHGKYSFTKKLTTSIIEGDVEDDAEGDVEVDTEGDAAVDAADNKNKLKGKGKGKDSSAAGTAPGENQKTPHWKKLKKTWEGFYEHKFHRLPTFNGMAAKHLKSILTRLETHPRPAGAAWTEEYAVRVLERFLQRAYDHSSWLKNNFLMENLSQKFDAIVSTTKGEESKGGKNGQNEDYESKRKKLEEKARALEQD